MTHKKSLSRGGVTPPRNLFLSSDTAIENAPVPSIAVIPLLQHAGSAARCVVQPGEIVREGMLIGKADGASSANIHSSIPGRVAEVRPWSPAGAPPCEAVVIELGGSFEKSGRRQQTRGWEDLSRIDLLGRIQAAGVVGLGGEQVPTHLKLALTPGRIVSLLVANGVDCEPSLNADSALMREKAREIAEGVRICRALLNPARIVLALGEESEGLAAEYERNFAALHMSCEILVMPSRYPRGNEQLILSTLNGGKPAAPSPSAVVLNVATLNAIYEAVALDRPLIDRVLTVTGDAVAAPKNLKVRIGTRIGDLFDDCGGFILEPGRIVMGGPMRGVAVASLDMPVTKGTLGVVAFSRAEAREHTQWPCIRCGACIEACPWDLVPTRLFKLIQRGDSAIAEAEGLSRCTECGCCAFACPSHIPLVEVMHQGKREQGRGANG
ncbi:MAG: electron transport complex subunit RsxC [Spirochaetia bacterium]|jgi:electron transport complex protein RnfC